MQLPSRQRFKECLYKYAISTKISCSQVHTVYWHAYTLYEYNLYEYNILLPILMLEIRCPFPKPCTKALFASKHTLFLFQNYHLE